MNNLHLTLTSFANRSRILKETKTLADTGWFKRIWIVGLHEEGLLEHEKIDAKRSVWRVKLLTRSWSKSFLFQIFKFFEFCIRVIRFFKMNEIKVVSVHCLDLLPLGVLLKLAFNIKLVYDTHELETEREGGPGFRRQMTRIVERMLIPYADMTIVVGWKIEEFYREKYQTKSIVTILNCPPFYKANRGSFFRDELHIPQEKKIVLYLGGLVKERGVELLLSAFASYPQERYVIVFMGFGELSALVKSYVSRCSKIYFREAVSPEKVISYAASADIGVHAMEDTCQNHRFALPNKLFECIMANIPVVVANLPEMSSVVVSRKIGVVMERWDSEAVFSALEKLEQMDKESLSCSLSASAMLFSWENQAEKMVGSYREFLGMP